MQQEQGTILLESGTNELEIVVFQLVEQDDKGNEVTGHFGVNVAKVREIIRAGKLTKLEHSDGAIAGIMQLRDNIIPVLNLSRVLERNSESVPHSTTIVLEFNGVQVGVLVHGVTRIHRISWENVEAPPPCTNSRYTTSVVKSGDNIILLLDFEKIVGEIAPQTVCRSVDPNQMGDVDLSEKRSQHRILIADDSTFIRQSVTSALVSAGYRIVQAGNGQQAWNLLMTGKDGKELPYSLLVTDVEMPEMDGLHLTSRLRADSFYQVLPIVIFSSLGSEDNARKWSGVGANHILSKPDLPKLVGIVDQLTGVLN